MNSEEKEYRFLWFIENYSYCWQQNGEALYSPDFTFDGLKGTAWYLAIYPRGYSREDRGNISLKLVGKANDLASEGLTVKYELSLLAADGSTLCSKESEDTSNCFPLSGFYQFVQTDEIHLRRKAEYLPNDTLTVCCKIWKGERDVWCREQVSARTRIIPEHFSFRQVVKSFSTLEANEKRTTKIRSNLFEERVISSSLCVSDEDTIIMEISKSHAMQILKNCKISLWNGYLIERLATDFECDAEITGIYKIPLSLTRKDVLDNKSKYLQNDSLILWCEYSFTIKLSEEIVETSRAVSLIVTNKKTNYTPNKDVSKISQNILGYSSALEDMKALYISQKFIDVELRTKTKSFPAHKIVLCARSPVFEAMMASEMKEKISACIQVDDLEDETVEQLLLFLYSDSLENLKWDNATQLYYAADKYQIEKLKALCSSFLAKNLSTSNVSDLLLFSDTYNDSNLLKIVRDFIFKHEEEIYNSIEWEKLQKTNPQLVINTMCLKYKRRKLS